MNSEKVKEIKKALEQNDDNGIMYEVNDEKRTCKFIHHKDILTLINELESENERLQEENSIIKSNPPIIADRSVGKTIRAKLIDYDRLKQFNKSLKDRIAELEKENEELLKENEGYHGSYRCAIDKIGELSAEKYIKVEQFAERLKKKFCYDCSRYGQLCDSECEHLIDETLKEFIDE